MTQTTDADVIIVGAGPVGLVTALMIAKEGIRVTVLEGNHEVIQSPRAMAYGVAAVEVLEKAGIAQDCRDTGLGEADFIRWITVDGKVIAKIPRPAARYDPVICGQHLVAAIILKHLEPYPHAKVLFNHRISGLKDHGDSVTAVCDTPEGRKEFTGRYLVGADGARSTVRKLIGCTFEGFTYDKMVVATNVHYPFQDHGFSFAQFIVHPDHFALIAKVDRHGLWRCSYGEDASLTYDEAKANLEKKYEAIFPGPRPLKYEIEMFSPYKLHQRCSNKFRVGNAVLAGDAAHANNPFGGMGLTTGLCDAGGLADCLIGIFKKACGDDLLDKYADIRMEKFKKITNPVSQANIERLFKIKNPEKAEEEDPFYKRAQELGDTPEFAKAMVNGMLALGYDFTQYYPENQKTSS